MAKILLVDDDADFSAALARMLVQDHYVVCVTRSATLALEQLGEKETADLVIADLRLCRESGLHLLAELHRRKPAMPVILLSASPDADSYLEAWRLGAYEYLGKPLDFAELRAVVERALNPVGRLS